MLHFEFNSIIQFISIFTFHFINFHLLNCNCKERIVFKFMETLKMHSVFFWLISLTFLAYLTICATAAAALTNALDTMAYACCARPDEESFVVEFLLALSFFLCVRHAADARSENNFWNKKNFSINEQNSQRRSFFWCLVKVRVGVEVDLAHVLVVVYCGWRRCTANERCTAGRTAIYNGTAGKPQSRQHYLHLHLHNSSK